MTGIFGLPVTCPYCGGDVELVTTGRSTTWATCGVVACTECSAEIVVRITLHADEHQPQRPIDHGTAAGYQTHLRRGEPACPSCLAARNAYYRGRRQTSRDQLTLTETT